MRLGMKLTLAFLVVGLLGVALVALLAGQTTQSLFRQFNFDQYQAGLVSRLQTYFSEHQGWVGIADEMPQIEGFPSDRPAPARPPGILTLTDSNGTVVAAGMGYRLGERVPEQDLAQANAIEVDGQTVGWMLAARERFADSPAEAALVGRINTALALGAVGAVLLSLVVGVVLARALSRPIQELTAATRAVAEGNLSQKVEVRSHDELGQLAASFNLMSERLARAQNLRRQMTADIAHELRTPLSVIQGNVEAMLDGVLPASPEELESIHQETILLNRLISDLRTLSLAEAGQLALDKQPLDLGEVVTRVAEKYRLRTEEQNVTLSVQVAPNLPQVSADAGRIEQALVNLTENALRYGASDAGGRVTLGARAVADGVEAWVSDTGPGIAPEDLPHVFERFWRSEKSRNRQTGGSGIGLALVKQLIEAHGGRVSVESTPGHGATFCVMLPTS